MSDKYKIRHLNKSEFEEWDSFVDECGNGTIFNKSFWLKNLFRNQKNVQFNIIGCFDKDSKLIGGFAFGSIKKFSIFSIIVSPHLTPYSSILIKERNSNYGSKTEAYRLNLLEEIVRFLDKNYSQVTITFSPKFEDIRCFTWNNYSEKIKYTYFSDIEKVDDIFDSFDPDVKRQIKKLGEGYTINKEDSAQTFYSLQEKSFSRQEHAFKLSENHFIQFLQNLQSNNCYKVFTIYELEKPVYSTIIIYHKQTAYYWLAGGDPEFFAKGYNKVLLWEIIKDLKEKGIKYFDFVGANTPNISKYKSNFSFKLVPYYNVEKINNSLLRILLNFKSIIKKS